MNSNEFRIMTGIAIAEAILIVFLIALGHRGVRVIFKSGPVVDPLEMALDYESPDKKFEEVVKQNPAWINYRLLLPDKTLAEPTLASCAVLNRTNYVRILIANGADVEAAVHSLNIVGEADAVKLIREVESEVRSQNTAVK